MCIRDRNLSGLEIMKVCSMISLFTHSLLVLLSLLLCAPLCFESNLIVIVGAGMGSGIREPTVYKRNVIPLMPFSQWFV